MQLQRFRGDTQGQALILRRNGANVDLDELARVEFTFLRSEVPIILTCVRDPDPTTGRVTIPFTEDSVSTAGFFPYDVQAVYTDGTKLTFIQSVLELMPDINPT